MVEETFLIKSITLKMQILHRSYILMEFSKEFDKYQLFWDMVDELDHKTHF